MQKEVVEDFIHCFILKRVPAFTQQAGSQLASAASAASATRTPTTTTTAVADKSDAGAIVGDVLGLASARGDI